MFLHLDFSSSRICSIVQIKLRPIFMFSHFITSIQCLVKLVFALPFVDSGVYYSLACCKQLSRNRWVVNLEPVLISGVGGLSCL